MLTIIFYLLFLVFTLVYLTIFFVVFVVTLPFDRKRSAMHFMSRVWAKCYFGVIPRWRVKVEGLENVDKSKSYVIVVNHRSMLDILLMYVVPLEFKWVSKKEVYKWPIFGWVLRMHGDITIERGTTGAINKMVKEGKEWLSNDVSVIIFPEGSRGKTPDIGRFKEGAFVLAKRAEVGILPCVSEGTGTAFNGWKLNFKNRFRVRVLPAISPEEVQATEIKEMTRKVREIMVAEYENIRTDKIEDKK